MSEFLKQELKDGLLILTMDRADRNNALNGEMLSDLVEATATAANNDEVRAVLLKGAGNYFCVGGDVKAMNDGQGRELSLGERMHSLRDRMNVSRYLHEMPKPTIAVIQGAAAGAGLSMALACDFRICADNAKITTAFANVGLSGDFGGTYFLSKILGSAKARELYLLSPKLSGKEAHEMGLMTRSVSAETVQAEGLQFAKDLANGPTLILGKIKQNLNLAEDGGSLGDCLDQEARNHTLSTLTEDHKEAAMAFIEKRRPIFVGK